MSVYIDKLTAPYYARRFATALFELENLQLSYAADRDMQYAIANKYKYEKGNKYKRAQIAAFKADEDVIQIKAIEKKKRAIFRDFHKVWGIYTGNAQVGLIVADYLKTKGDVKFLEEKYEQGQINEALVQWFKFVDTTADLATQRLREEQAFKKRLREDRKFLKGIDDKTED